MPRALTTPRARVYRYKDLDGVGGATDQAVPLKFGKVASKDIWRDIARFLRVLLVDLLPGDSAVNEAVGMYLELWCSANAPAHTRLTLLHLDTLAEDCMSQLVLVFTSKDGTNPFSARPKTCGHRHFGQKIGKFGALCHLSDALFETSHLRHVKEPFDHTNAREPIGQMARYVTRRDTTELLRDKMLQVRHAEAGGGLAGADPIAHGGAIAGNQLMGTAAPKNRSYDLHMHLSTLPAEPVLLKFLPFAIRQFLFQATDGPWHQPVSAMPQLDADKICIHPGVNLQARRSEKRVRMGGALLNSNLLADGHDSKAPLIVSIESDGSGQDGTEYYGQLMLCFTAKYLGGTLELCFVRWLEKAKSMAREAGVPATAEEARGPFTSYRWARYPRGGGRGHPTPGEPWCGVVDVSSIRYRAHMPRSLHDDGLFRLNTDAWQENL